MSIDSILGLLKGLCIVLLPFFPPLLLHLLPGSEYEGIPNEILWMQESHVFPKESPAVPILQWFGHKIVLFEEILAESCRKLLSTAEPELEAILLVSHSLYRLVV